jgi:hypothetical protein
MSYQDIKEYLDRDDVELYHDDEAAVDYLV